MKRIVCTLLALAMLLSLSSVALASDLGVQVIGGPDVESGTMSLDNIQVGQKYTIDGYATIDVVSFDFLDAFAQYSKGAAGNNDIINYINGKPSEVYPGENSGYYRNAVWNDSGSSADFAWLVLNITNLQKQDIAYFSEASVKVVFDDEYEFQGWIRQVNFDYATSAYRYNHDGKYYGESITLDPDDEESIGMMYTGTFIFGCTLPNAVVESKAPLRIEITLGGNELTYNIRK